MWACIGFGYAGVHGVLFNLYMVRLGFGSEHVGTANGALLLALALFSFPAGWLGRRFGSRRMLIFGMGLALVYGLVPVCGFVTRALRFPLLLVNAVVFGCGAATVLVNNQPFLMANTTPELRNRVFAMRAAVSPLFAFAGAFAGGALPHLLAHATGAALSGPGVYGASLLVVPLAFVISVVALLLTREVDDGRPLSGGTVGRGPAPVALMLALSVVNLMVMGSIRSTQIFFSHYLDAGLRVSTFLVGGAAAAAQLLSVPSAALMPVLARRLGRPGTLLAAVGLLVLGQAGLALVRHWVAAGVSLAVVTAAFVVFESAFTVHGQELVGRQWREVLAGAVTAARGISASAVVFGGGYLVRSLGHQPLFLLNAALALAGLGALLFVRAPEVPGTRTAPAPPTAV